ncbi:DUF1453 domain-containing protein [Kitasatospora sp. LaBMicrA B282]|uniref:DUF1453 domain-containing protein n=1 Tax=Kitasatospora sp. LaBMicrA B282 TaxID=3420949 RepID=UPI003D108FB1
MTGTANILVILAVVVLVLARQVRARRIDTERRFWVLPLVLGALGLAGKHLIDPHHQVLAVVLLLAGVLAEVAMGSVWGWTVKMWRATDGSVWIKGNAATLAAWVGTIAVRIGLFALGSALHVQQGANALYLGLGVLLLVRGAVVNWRARGLESAPVLSLVD